MFSMCLSPPALLLSFVLVGGACQSNGAASTSGSVAAAAGKVAVEANEKGFVPSSVTARKGEPVTLVFKRTTDDTCATKVVFPELGISKDLPLNQPVEVSIPAGDAKTFTFQCGMGMFKGKIVIS